MVEAEFNPAANVEPEAKDRLGLEVASNGRVIEAAIALRYPEEIRQAADLHAALRSARLRYCVFTEEADGASRFPSSGWLEGSVEDLADMVRLVSVPQRAVDAATMAMEQGIDRVAAMLDEMDKSRPAINMNIARLLGMTNVPQMRRMACAIIVNAMVFHDRIAGMHPEISPLRLVCGPGVPNPEAETLEAWSRILKINYWPIFSIAADILNQLPSDYASQILRTLHYTVGELAATGVENAHDLTGRIFQKLIADRKYLATFYTLPASAALLARLAVAKMEGVDWSDAEAIGKLRIGDFACGTGALLSAVYEQIASRYERTGGNPKHLHRVMMEEVLYGCDVMPSAVHITGSTLAGAHPNVGYDESHLYSLAYGRLRDLSVRIGSLELLTSESAMSLYNTNDPNRRTGSIGEETASLVVADIPDGSFDLVIMNPPFTRATNHEGAHADITNPAFAAFGATRVDQTAMGERINRMGRGTCYHGNAGIASAFAALAHKKLRPGGVLALVLPLSAASGRSWQDFRKMLANNYTDVSVPTIVGSDNDNISFSSETGMAECLVIARRLKQGEKPLERACYTSLRSRSEGFAHANSLARELLDSSRVRRIEDGPYGGTPVKIGGEPAGEMITTPRSTSGENWGAVRLLDCSLAQVAYALSRSRLWLPGTSSSAQMKTAWLSELGNLGLVHRDITGPAPRGPFDMAPASPSATYPSLWNHKAENETQFVCTPDSQLVVRQGMEEKAATVWATASCAHISLDFRFNSQPLSASLTEDRSIGGRAWPNVIFDDNRIEYAFVLWSNSTLGLLAYWWHSNRQVAGRGTTTITALPSLPVLDFRALTDAQLATAEAIFDEFRDKELKPAYLADADPNRALLDERVVCDLLGFDRDTYEAVRRLSAKWCAEPSVHGGKARPRGASLVM